MNEKAQNTKNTLSDWLFYDFQKLKGDYSELGEKGKRLLAEIHNPTRMKSCQHLQVGLARDYAYNKTTSICKMTRKLLRYNITLAKRNALR